MITNWLNQIIQISGTISRKSGKSPPKLELASTITLHHEGTEPSETKVDVQLVLKETKQNSNKHQQINIKSAVINGPSGESEMMCLDFDNRLGTRWDDPLAYSDQSEPTINQTIALKIGKFPSGEPSRQSSVQDLPCLNNHAEMTFTGDAQRSHEQIVEATAAATPPYDQCVRDKASNLWPGKFIPPTTSCEVAMMEQTSLRSANLSLCYKVNGLGFICLLSWKILFAKKLDF